MEKKLNRRTRMTKLLLKASLIELLQSKSLHHITIKEICENADLNRSTFYLHYTDQYALLAEIEQDVAEQTKNYLEKVASDAEGVTYLEIFLNYIKENEKTFRILLCGQDNFDFQTLFIENTLAQIKAGRQGTISAPIEKYVYDFIIYGCIHMIIEWIQSGFDVSCEELADTIFKMADCSLKKIL